MNSGNPVFNTGWLQDLYIKPCELNFLQGSGAFSLAPMDRQRVVYALIVGHGETHLESILDLRRNTNFIRDVFRNEFQMKAWTDVEMRTLSQPEMEMDVRTKIETDMGVQSVQADLFTYGDSLVHTIDLFDDGANGDILAGDFVFSRIFTLNAIPRALFLNLRIKDGSGDEHLFSHARDNISVIFPNIFISEIDVVADHLNSDGKINPGENVRLSFGIKNDLPFKINSLNVLMRPDSANISADPKHFFFKDIGENETVSMNYNPQDETTYFEINVSNDIPAGNPINNRIYLKYKLYANEHYIWDRGFSASLSVEPLDYVPNTVLPAHIAGFSSAKFEISVIQPDQLTGHAYAITVSDSINEDADQGFNLIDQTLGDTLLKHQAAPDFYAHNIPITDGFKVIKAFLPEDEISGYFDAASGGDLQPFSGINSDGSLSKAYVTFGSAPLNTYCQVEIEFTNRIDTSGVLGVPSGQGGFQHTFSPVNGIAGFFPCGINVWKIVDDQRLGRLNIIFEEFDPAFPTYNETWTPGEWLYIMSCEYDETGQLYMGLPEIPLNDVLYKLKLVLRSPYSYAGPGDKLDFERLFVATAEDMWLFTPTKSYDEEKQIPTRFQLLQNYPNPFNPTTTIRFSIEKNSKVSLKIYNILGQEVAELFNRVAMPGEYAVNWDGNDRFGRSVVSGIYFARLETSAGTRLIKMALIR